MATRPQPNQLQTNAGPMIGLALWVGVLLFGGVSWFMHRTGKFPTNPVAPQLTYAQLGVSVLAVAAAFVLKGQIGRLQDGPERNTKILMAWASGEFAALFGCVIFLLSGEAQWYGVGLLAMLTAFVLVPLRRPT